MWWVMLGIASFYLAVMVVVLSLCRATKED
jgi:hypothetical protein